MLRRAKQAASMLALALLFAAGLAAGTRAAGNYTIDWWTADGGGGASSGGAYVVSGTIGQFDAAASSGGAYSLAGGFWAGATAQYRTWLPLTLR